MSRDRVFPLFIAAVTCAALSLNPTAAHAEKVKTSDSRGDVIAFVGESETPAPDNVTADVVKSVINHSAKRVKVKVRIVDLTSGTARAGVIASIRTNKKHYDLSLFKIKGLGSSFDLSDARGNKINCPGKKKAVSTADDTIRISVPRTCLKSPRWVSIGVGVIGFDDPGFFADDALRSGLRRNGNLTFGPKLQHG